MNWEDKFQRYVELLRNELLRLPADRRDYILDTVRKDPRFQDVLKAFRGE